MLQSLQLTLSIGDVSVEELLVRNVIIVRQWEVVVTDISLNCQVRKGFGCTFRLGDLGKVLEKCQSRNRTTEGTEILALARVMNPSTFNLWVLRSRLKVLPADRTLVYPIRAANSFKSIWV